MSRERSVSIFNELAEKLDRGTLTDPERWFIVNLLKIFGNVVEEYEKVKSGKRALKELLDDLLERSHESV